MPGQNGVRMHTAANAAGTTDAYTRVLMPACAWMQGRPPVEVARSSIGMARLTPKQLRAEGALQEMGTPASSLRL